MKVFSCRSFSIIRPNFALQRLHENGFLLPLDSSLVGAFSVLVTVASFAVEGGRTSGIGVTLGFEADVEEEEEAEAVTG